MYYSGIKYSDMLNGEGIRVSLFLSGCSHKCKGCFNKDTWGPKYGQPFTSKEEDEIFNYIGKYNKLIKGISLLGGDPTYHSNIDPLIKFINKFKEKFPKKDIWIWSGYTWLEIISSAHLFSLIKLCDVLIEGRFVLEKKDLSLKWRGSSNQNVIDIKKSIANDTLCFFAS